MEQELANTLEIHKHLGNFRAYVNSFEKWKAPSGETLTLTEIIVTKNTFPFLRGIPISEIEKYHDSSRARWNVTTSRTNHASATIDAYGVDVNKTKVKFIDGYVSYEFPHELPRRKQRGIKNFKFCHSALDAESSPVFWIPASAGMTNSPQAAGNTTRRDLLLMATKKESLCPSG